MKFLHERTSPLAQLETVATTCASAALLLAIAIGFSTPASSAEPLVFLTIDSYTQGAAVAQASAAPLPPLYRYIKAGDRADFVGQSHGDWTRQGILGYLGTETGEGRVALRQCQYALGTSTNMVSSVAATCELPPIPAIIVTDLGTLGYVWTAASEDRVGIYRCVLGTDVFSSKGVECGGGVAQNSGQPLFYVQKTAVLKAVLSIAAEPQTVQSGRSGVVTWSAINAVSCSVTANEAPFATGLSGSVSTGALATTTVYRLLCLDGDGTQSGRSSKVAVTQLDPDRTKPTVSVTQPATGPVSGTLSIAADATDPESPAGRITSGVAGVQFKLDNVALGPEDATAPYTYLGWDTRFVTNGGHTIAAVARDVAGNYATSTLKVTVTNTGAVAVYRYSNGFDRADFARESVAGWTREDLLGYVSPTKKTGLVALRQCAYTFSGFTVRSSSVGDVCDPPPQEPAGITVKDEGTLGYVWTTPRLDLAPIYRCLVDIDVFSSRNSTCGGGVVQNSGRPLFYIQKDSTPQPALSIEADPAAVQVGKESTVRWSAVNVSSCAVTKGSQTFAAGLSGTKPTGTLTATSTYTLTCQKSEGGTATTRATVGVSPLSSDKTRPTVSLAVPRDGSTVSGTVYMTAEATDPASPAGQATAGLEGVVFTLDGALLGLGEDKSAPYLYSWDTKSTPNGSHTLRVVARDKAGNYATTTIGIKVANASSPVKTTALYRYTLTVKGYQTHMDLPLENYGDWSREGNLGYIATQVGEGLVPLYQCIRQLGYGAQDPYSYTEHCPGSDQNKGLMGYVWTTPAEGRTPIYRCTRSMVVKDYWIFQIVLSDTYSSGRHDCEGNGSVLHNGTANFYLQTGENQPELSLTALPDHLQSGESSTISWSAWNVSSCALTRGPEPFASTLSGFKSTEALAADTQFSLACKDAVGKTVSKSVKIQVTRRADSVAPTVALTWPPMGEVSGKVGVTAEASDSAGVAGVQFKLDGVNLGPEKVAAPYSYRWDTSVFAKGVHALVAVARDFAGNYATSSRQVVVADPSVIGVAALSRYMINNDNVEGTSAPVLFFEGGTYQTGVRTGALGQIATQPGAGRTMLYQCLRQNGDSVSTLAENCAGELGRGVGYVWTTAVLDTVAVFRCSRSFNGRLDFYLTRSTSCELGGTIENAGQPYFYLKNSAAHTIAGNPAPLIDSFSAGMAEYATYLSWSTSYTDSCTLRYVNYSGVSVEEAVPPDLRYYPTYLATSRLYTLHCTNPDGLFAAQTILAPPSPW